MSKSLFSASSGIIKKRNGFPLNLTYQGLTEIPEDVIRKHAVRTSTLDVSYNNLKSLFSLKDFHILHTIILDNNALDENLKFPCIFNNVKCLSINNNRINNLCVFINRMSEDLPNLQHLSMMKNEAAPSYFNGGTKTQNQDYRYYVISSISGLVTLDGQEVTTEEKEKAYKTYGRRWKIRKRTGTSVY